jgi:hypothetical protein
MAQPQGSTLRLAATSLRYRRTDALTTPAQQEVGMGRHEQQQMRKVRALHKEPELQAKLVL